MTRSFSARPADLQQLLYRSHSVDGVASALEMSDILDEARPANARDGITGVLTVIAGNFIQIIEGDNAALGGLLERLLRDGRHTRLQVLERRPVTVRAFPDWEMISPRLMVDEVDLLAGLLEDHNARLDAYVPVLARAVVRQGAAVEALWKPVSGQSQTRR